MKKNSSILTHHILDAIASVERIIDQITFEDFIKNEEKCLASIRLLEIIGEASSQLKKLDLELFNKLGLQPSVSMRHILIHDYDQVDMAIVWKTIHTDLPLVKKSIQSSPALID